MAEPPDAADPPAVLTRPEGPLPFPSPPLSDGVVTLGELRDDDIPEIVASCSDAEAARWLPLPSPYTPADARDWLAAGRIARQGGDALELAIRAAQSGPGSYLGATGLHFGRCRAGEAEIGYLVSPAARGRGVAQRALRLLVPWAFVTFRPRRIELLIQPENTASRRVAEAAGATFEGIRGAGLGFRTGEVADAAVYAFVGPAALRSGS